MQEVRAPGVDGSFGVLARHAPMLTELMTGLIKLTLTSGMESYIATSGGFMQISRRIPWKTGVGGRPVIPSGTVR